MIKIKFKVVVMALLLGITFSNVSAKTPVNDSEKAFVASKLADKKLTRSQRIVYSQISRFPQAWMLDNLKALKWTYTAGLEIESFLQVAQKYNDTFIRNYVYAYTDSIVSEDGSIHTYKPSEYNIDHINSGKLLFKVYNETKNPKYLKAIELLYSQLKTHPRTSEGGFWHKNIYPHQMWLDGLYMGTPFLAQYAKEIAPNKTELFDDITNQFRVVAKHTYDPKTKLYRHAWDEAKAQPWADPTTGQSAHTWGRAQGWFFMALVDVLDFVPADYPKRGELLTLLKSIADGVVSYQDPKTGLWYQVMDQPGREGNYLEATCSSMFSYCLIKSAQKGYLNKSYKKVGLKALKGLDKNLIRTNADHTLSLTKCCAVAGLGGKENRSGKFDYYINEKINENDPKGTGPYIKANLLIE